MNEHIHQSRVIDWYRVTYKQYKTALFAIPNGFWLDGMNKAKAQRYIKHLKAEGYTPGVPDLFLAIPRMSFGGLWIEMKARKEDLKSPPKVSKEQHAIGSMLLNNGYLACSCEGKEEAKQIIGRYLANEFHLYPIGERDKLIKAKTLIDWAEEVEEGL